MQRSAQLVRVGVIGHRWNRISISADSLYQRCRSALEAVAEAARAPGAARPARLRAISALAEGADRLTAAAALDLGAELVCLLPFAAGEYERDFESPSSRAEFQALLRRAAEVSELPGRREAADRAYEAVGRAVMNQADLLLAVWDGQPAAGRGGTTQIIEEALRRGLPVIHIHADAEREPCLLRLDPRGQPVDDGALPLRDALRRTALAAGARAARS